MMLSSSLSWRASKASPGAREDHRRSTDDAVSPTHKGAGYQQEILFRRGEQADQRIDHDVADAVNLFFAGCLREASSRRHRRME